MKYTQRQKRHIQTLTCGCKIEADPEGLSRLGAGVELDQWDPAVSAHPTGLAIVGTRLLTVEQPVAVWFCNRCGKFSVIFPHPEDGARTAHLYSTRDEVVEFLAGPFPGMAEIVRRVAERLLEVVSDAVDNTE